MLALVSFKSLSFMLYVSIHDTVTQQEQVQVQVQEYKCKCQVQVQVPSASAKCKIAKQLHMYAQKGTKFVDKFELN